MRMRAFVSMVADISPYVQTDSGSSSQLEPLLQFSKYDFTIAGL